MAKVVSGNKIKLNNGNIIEAKQGEWWDSQQFWDGTLSDPGQINKLSNQQGAGQQVSNEVIAQTNPANVAYVQQQRQQAQPQQQAPAVPYGNNANPTSGGQPGAGVNFQPSTPTIDLQGLFKKYQEESGIGDLEKKLSGYIDEYNTAQAAINDDPFLAESNRVGRAQKLSTDFDNRVANIKNDIATKKADIETKMQLDMKQFDINSEAAQAEFNKFQTLLSMGALDNASGEDIANITRATGISSDMIRSAISTTKQKNTPTQLISYDDGVNQGFAIVNPQTGEIIKQQVVAASNAGGSSGSSILNESRQFELDQKQAPALAAQAAKGGKTLKDMISFYSQWLDPTTIYNIYNQNSIYGAAKEAKTAEGRKLLQSWGVKIK